MFALLMVGACSTPPDGGGTENTGGSTPSSSGGRSGSGGTPSGSGGGSSSSGGQPGSSGGQTGSSGGAAGSGSGSGGAAGSGSGSGGTAGGTGGMTTTPPDGGGNPPPDSGPPPAVEACTDEPMSPAPALKKGLTIAMPKDQPGQVVGVPGEDIMYVMGHTSGDVHIVQGGKVLTENLAHVGVAGAGNGPEQGLLSMALHPQFKTNKLFYIFYTAAGGGNMTIDEFERMTPTTSVKKRNVYNQPRVNGSPYHNGGSVYFNPKDAMPYLYLAVGNHNNPAESAKPEGPAGRVFRFDLTAGTKVTYAYGLRNPYRMSIDRLTGDMWIGEVANAAGGSVLFNKNGAMGTNFGYGGGGEVRGGISGFQGGNAALIGGVVYRGKKIKGLCGRYFFGMHSNGAIRSIVQQNGMAMGGVADHPTLSVPGQISSFGEDGEGEIWMSSRSSAVIIRIEAM